MPMNRIPQQRTSVSTLLGAMIFRAGGEAFGRVREFAVAPLLDASKIEALVVQAVGASSRAQRAYVPVTALQMGVMGRLEILPETVIEDMPRHDDFLMLERDLLDQQIIDVHGHKVVRVNDVDLVWECVGAGTASLMLRVAEVEVGTRGALRRLLKGLPSRVIDRVTCHVRPSVIPWEFVDLIDRDPSRRVRLKIEQDKLARMHPSDLADILEDLAPAEREALFSSLDEEVAAEALEEVEPKTQKTLLDSMNSEQIAGILEEMDPGAAADLLAELPEAQSEAILGEMGDYERQEVEELLDYAPDSAAGLMTTDYVAVRNDLTVGDAMRSLREFEGDLESVTEIFVVSGQGHLEAVIPCTRLALEDAARPLREIEVAHLVSTELNVNGKKVAELFDKYNLRSLAVLDEHGQLAGVIRPEHVIAWLRAKL